MVEEVPTIFFGKVMYCALHGILMELDIVNILPGGKYKIKYFIITLI